MGGERDSIRSRQSHPTPFQQDNRPFGLNANASGEMEDDPRLFQGRQARANPDPRENKGPGYEHYGPESSSGSGGATEMLGDMASAIKDKISAGAKALGLKENESE